jgi:hypothetical protein
MANKTLLCDLSLFLLLQDTSENSETQYICKVLQSTTSIILYRKYKQHDCNNFRAQMADIASSSWTIKEDLTIYVCLMSYAKLTWIYWDTTAWHILVYYYNAVHEVHIMVVTGGTYMVLLKHFVIILLCYQILDSKMKLYYFELLVHFSFLCCKWLP